MRLLPTDSIVGTVERIWIEKTLPVLRELFFNESVWRLPGSKQAFQFARHFFKLGRIPLFRDNLPEFDPEKSNMSWIPINQDIEGVEDIPLPLQILDRLIEKARHRVIVNCCGCRVSMRCEHYPDNIGCLMMGVSALQIPEGMCQEVGVDEAKAHVRKAVDLGLVPITGRARLDNDLFLIPDDGKLLTVCLCCECCCITRFTSYLPQNVIDGLQHPVEGLTIEVTDECIGCGECISKCYINAIELREDRSVITGMCRVCGRCAAHCPQNAIKLKLDNPHAADDVVRRIESVVDF